MKVLGINTSHETSICSMTDGKIDYYHEEARWNRDKHYCPDLAHLDDDNGEWGMLCLDHAFEETPADQWDTIGIASFDRRNVDFRISEGEPEFIENVGAMGMEPIDVNMDRMMFEDLADFMRSEPVTPERIEEARSIFKGQEENPIIHAFANTSIDQQLNSGLAKKYNIEKFDFLQNEHHLYHAFAGLYMSPFKESLVLVCDGGGARHLWEDGFQCYGEIESIYYMDEQTVQPLFKHLTNNRDMTHYADGNESFYDMNFFSHQTCFDMDAKDNYGYDVRLSSLYSEGQKFSMLSQMLDLDEMGRAAGKVMGLASYGLAYPWEKYTPSGIAAELQRETVHHTAELIQRALDYKPECKNIILSGGYALNCVGNYQYLDMFKGINFFIDPASHDGGTAIGSCVKNTFYKDTGYTV